ncbi:bifunctional folylpolyglutamate synthase/dihydrofolate synthase, partial [Francisella tularensis subsp. holarctica]|nr:bifunctional folylpolyglutamate synthase/dihydrofolate synthase [Francisella tularensis subsp. holarctica]
LREPHSAGPNLRHAATFGHLATKDIREVLKIAKQHVYKWDVIDLKYLNSRAADLEKIKQEFKLQQIIRVDYNKELRSVSLAIKDTLKGVL